MLTPDARDAWLDPDATPDELLAVMASEAPTVVADVVSRDVGNVRNNRPDLVTPLG
jgi:putative SOS response-associated peptidase YedK